VDIYGSIETTKTCLEKLSEGGQLVTSVLCIGPNQFQGSRSVVSLHEIGNAQVLLRR